MKKGNLLKFRSSLPYPYGNTLGKEDRNLSKLGGNTG
jgi:hypothetical protein